MFQHPMQGVSQRLPMQMSDDLRPETELGDYMLYAEPYLGWRAWAIVIRKNKIRLQSLTYKVNWTPQIPFHARCLSILRGSKVQPEHDCAPNKYHKCGIYAVNSKDKAILWKDSQHGAGFKCYGTVKLWGIVYRYEHGYLAEYAYPKEIWIPHQAPKEFELETREAMHELQREYFGVKIKMM